MLVMRVVGDCPGCGTINSFGNVHVVQDVLIRGCGRCKYSEKLPLPPLSKRVLYLDQCFHSHAFRSEVSEYVEASHLISELSNDQLLVCPYSPIHEIETHQWRHTEQQNLWKFIKQVSRGHKFSHEHEVKQRQILLGFKRFLEHDRVKFPIVPADALPRRINNWDDYFWIELRRSPDDVELIRRLKKEAVEHLVSIFDEWRSKGTTTFEEDRKQEDSAAAELYLKFAYEMLQRLRQGDYNALLDSPIDAKIVTSLLHQASRILSPQESLSRVMEYLQSPFFAEVPCEYISSGLFAVLRARIKSGQYSNAEKAKEQLGGIFYDVKFISLYAPYCHAMFVDKAMFQFLQDSRLGLTERFGTRFFSKANWAEFIAYLETIKMGRTDELRKALLLVYS